MDNRLNFYTLLQDALLGDSIDTKERIVQQALEYCSKNSISPNKSKPILFETPSYSTICQIVDPRDLPARKHFDTKDGLVTLVHAIAHIEFSAVDLALDAVYRFPSMPTEFKHDWLVVAQDEIRHFKMLQNILHELDACYGDLPVHQGLFDASMHTATDVLDRMAVIPRHYEAGGLDVNPQIIKKLENRAKDPIVAMIIDAMNTIEAEEIDHVHKGDKWFKYICQERALEPVATFQTILDKYKLHRHKPHMNISARKKAGFECEELLMLGAKECN